jgi:Domain of unknown function (DUF4159)/Aerotolerance regulator N-terminal
MMGLPLGFAQPLVLLGLLILPILWWLLRMIPPHPRLQRFGPERQVAKIVRKEDTPARTPWWLTLLRLTLAALVIIAAAGPQWNPPVAAASSSGSIALMIDDGWAAAASWKARMRTADELIARAEANRSGVALIPLSVPDRDISLLTPEAARVKLKQLKPKPHTIVRSDALPAITRFLSATPNAELIWLSDGVDADGGAAFVAALARAAGTRPFTVVTDGLPPAHALAAADNNAGALTVKVLRAAGSAENGVIRALDLKGLTLGETPFAFAAGERETDAKFTLPVEIRNEVARLEIAGEQSAGSVQLLDKRWRRRTVGVISGTTTDTAQPLLDATYYLTRALNPFADIRRAEGVSPAAAVTRFLDQKLPMLILADIGNVVGTAHDRLAQWIEDGGVLVRFAGPRLAAADDDLVPVKLRHGGRILGGSLSWEKPQHLAAFSADSPFNGMTVPNDVTVTRQVLAEPDANLPDRTWATLGDGTPLVTAARRGKGMIVLFHVTADTRWSNLPLSGAMVEMLKRIVAISGATMATGETSATTKNAAREVVPPNRVLDGFGAFGPPPPSARPVPAGYVARASADHPPGFYGPPEGLLAVNTLAPADRLKPLDVIPLHARIEAYRLAEPQDLRGPIFTAALALLLLDALVVFWLAGGLSRLIRRRRPAVVSIVLILFAAALVAPARAQTPAPAPPSASTTSSDDFAMRATLKTHLAYVVTGDAEVDAISKSGLEALTLFLAQRTALEPGDPIGLDVGRDELSFFPLIYWPVVPGAARPSIKALQRIDAYMKRGGTVLFDTRDAVEAPPGPGGSTRSPGMLALRNILGELDIPELEPVPPDHVLTKTFFLLRDFPGRFTSGQLWVQALPPANSEQANRPARGGDGVSPILITSNDLAGAWATQSDGQPMLPLVPGEPRQREFAFRAGVNIVMYTLTGNYKADQVHVPALLERLGQ